MIRWANRRRMRADPNGGAGLVERSVAMHIVRTWRPMFSA